MCGFAGFLSRGDTEFPLTLEKMGNAIVHRGPDASGIWYDSKDGIGFCHRRLSILDLSEAGAQPMVSKSGDLIIAFNGEIYNFLDIKAKLEADGWNTNWSGHSDTEVILASIQMWGIERTLKEMIGMFAIALWDKSKKELILARDRMGEKPLYFGWQGNSFLFGSELKSFFAHPEFKKEISLEALGKFFKYNYVPSGTSIYKGIQKLTPGTYCKVSVNRNQVLHFSYWSLEQCVSKQFSGAIDTDSHIEELENLLSNAIGQQMVADVPLGAFLSGGIDSSLIVSLMQAQSKRPVKTFSMGFNEQGFDEAVYAKKVAKHLGTDHTEMYVSPEEAQAIIPSLPAIYDEPFADSSQIPTFLVSKLAKSHVTVSLSGDAGDELFSGYNRYLMVNNVWSKLSKAPRSIRKATGNFLTRQSEDRLNKIYSSVEGLVPNKYKLSNFGEKMHKVARVIGASNASELYDGFISHWKPDSILSAETSQEIYNLDRIKNLTFIEKMMFIDATTYLPDDILVKVDRAAMANSLETRVPFLDHRVVEYAWNLPMNLKIREGKGKWILREILYKHVPKKLIERPKMGFGIPLDQWLRGPLREWVLDILSPDNLSKHGLLNSVEIQTKLREHMSGNKNWQYQLWDVLMFQSWYDKYH